MNKKKPVKKHHSHTDSDSKEESKNILGKLILPLIIVVIVIIIYLLMRGKTTTTGGFPSPVRTESLICEAEGKHYDKVDNLGSKTENIRVVALFDGTTSIQSIALKYTTTYLSKEATDKAHAHASVTLSQSLQDYGYDTWSLGSKFSVIDKTLNLDLYVKKEELNTESAQMFLVNVKNGLPTNMTDYKKNYVSQGFSCKASVDGI